MNFKEFLINEMPIGNFQKIGNWEKDDPKYNWDKKSLGILGSERGVEKIKRQWSNTKNTFDMYFVRKPGLRKYSNEGEVSEEWIQKNIDPEITVDPENITVIYINNIGDQKVPMTGWILGHRLGHAIVKTNSYKAYEHELHRFMSDIARDFYQKQIRWHHVKGEYPRIEYYSSQRFMKALAQSLGTMKSAKNNKIARYPEFTYEVLTQYLMSRDGKIKFNKNLPQILTMPGKFGRQEWISVSRVGEEEKKEIADMIENMEETIEYYLDSLFGALEGRAFVM